ncbi:MAG TPA: hypothetical protein VF188_00420 [Longimicrobiales bacterium]
MAKKPVPSAYEGLSPEEADEHANWLRRFEPIPDVDSPEELRAWLRERGMTFAEFQRTTAYRRMLAQEYEGRPIFGWLHRMRAEEE